MRNKLNTEEKPSKTDNSLINGTPFRTKSTTAFELSQIRVKNDLEFPISLDIVSEMQNILAVGVFKHLENPGLYDKLTTMMFSERYVQLVEKLFWTIFLIKFQKEDNELLEKLRKQLSYCYSEYFSLLQQPKEELSNIGIFGAGYISHILFFNLFTNQRKLFDMRFILDCYHIVIHEVNGVFVSDFYIQTSIERIFGSKFFHYEQALFGPKKIDKKDFKNEPLLRDLKVDLQDLPKVSGGLDLAYELSSKLRKVPRRLKPAGMNELNDSRGISTHGHKILRLTQPEENKSFASTSETSQPYFPKFKFNCHQISPTVSNFLENSSSSLPFQKKKIIHISANKQMQDGMPLNYQVNLNGEEDHKLEKKDKKHEPVGTIQDYKLGNRTNDYYLGYMPQEVKSKCKLELDMKYILDNIRPTMRGTYSLKSLISPTNKKLTSFISQTNKTQEVTKEEQQDENQREILEELNTEKGEPSMLEIPSEVKGIENAENQNVVRDALNETGLPVIKRKIRLREDVSNPSFRNSVNPMKKPHNYSRIEDEGNSTNEMSESKRNILSPTSPTLKFRSMLNKKLGKGRFFVSFDNNDDEQEQGSLLNTLPQKYKYVDNRKKYIAEHESSVRKDPDANIENLVHKLMAKKNSFHRNIIKRAKS